MLKGEQGSGPEGVGDLDAFTHMGNFLLLLLGLDLLAEIQASRMGFEPLGWDLGLQARILAFRLGFGPQGWDLGLKTGI